MATSGSVNLSTTRNDIIKGALRLVGAIQSGEEPPADEVADAADVLEGMIKEWAKVDGVRPWLKRQGVLFLVKGQASYSLGPTGDHASLTYVTTTLTAAVAASGTALPVTSITGISASDKIGVVLDDGTLHWDTVSGAPSGTTVTLTTGVASAAASGNRLFTYTNILQRPLSVIDARLKINNDQETPFADPISRDEYFDLPNKTSQGKPNQGYYDPQLTDGKFYIYQAPNDVKDVVLLDLQYPIEDFDAAGNNPEYPQEWFLALRCGLAVELGPEYDTPLPTMQWLKGITAEKKALLTGGEAEDASVFFQPELRQ
jgi:hypothetical protein